MFSFIAILMVFYDKNIRFYLQQREEQCCSVRRKNVTSDMMMGYMAEALLLLMRDTPYANITVGDITQKAGVNRSTYYRHFNTKEAIIRFYYDSIMRESNEAFLRLNSTDFRLYIRTRFETLYAHREDLLNLHRSGLSRLLMDVLKERFHFDELEKSSATDEQFRISYHLGGLYNNMLLWFNHGMAESPELMTDIAMSYRTQEAIQLPAMGENEARA